jgi:hypothetical protein
MGLLIWLAIHRWQTLTAAIRLHKIAENFSV